MGESTIRMLLTADERKAVEAIRRIAEAQAKLITGSKKVGDATGESASRFDEAFGGSALRTLATFATGVKSIELAYAAVKNVLVEVRRLQDEAENKARAAGPGFGRLGQLADTDAERKELDDAVFRLREHGLQMQAAQDVVFELKTAEMLDAVDIVKRASVTAQPQAMASALAVWRTAWGKAATPDPSRTMGQAVLAAKYMPSTSAEQFLQSTAPLAAIARELGMTPESLAAMSSIAGQPVGYDLGATVMRRLLFTAKEEGIKLKPGENAVDFVKRITDILNTRTPKQILDYMAAGGSQYADIMASVRDYQKPGENLNEAEIVERLKRTGHAETIERIRTTPLSMKETKEFFGRERAELGYLFLKKGLYEPEPTMDLRERLALLSGEAPTPALEARIAREEAGWAGMMRRREAATGAREVAQYRSGITEWATRASTAQEQVRTRAETELGSAGGAIQATAGNIMRFFVGSKAYARFQEANLAGKSTFGQLNALLGDDPNATWSWNPRVSYFDDVPFFGGFPNPNHKARGGPPEPTALDQVSDVLREIADNTRPRENPAVEPPKADR